MFACQQRQCLAGCVSTAILLESKVKKSQRLIVPKSPLAACFSGRLNVTPLSPSSHLACPVLTLVLPFPSHTPLLLLTPASRFPPRPFPPPCPPLYPHLFPPPPPLPLPSTPSPPRSSQDYTSKLTDFGLAKDGPDAGQTHVSTQIMGTMGYLDPRYAETGGWRRGGVAVPAVCR